MFLVKAGTVIQIERKKEKTASHYWHTSPWVPYTTTNDKLYEKEEVFDIVRVLNDHACEIPHWIRRNIVEHNLTVITRKGKYALVSFDKVEYLD